MFLFNTNWIPKFIHKTTKLWKNKKLNPKIYGCQIQLGTGWLPGLEQKEIQEMEQYVGFQLSEEVKKFLSHTNGLDKEQINANPPQEELRFQNEWHLNNITLKNRKELLNRYRNEETYKIIREDGLIKDMTLKTHFLLPIYSHRYVVCDQEDLKSSVVLSIYGDDIIIYGKNLKEYLENEFLKND